MNFELSNPQQLLRETTRSSLAKVCSKRRVRELMSTDTGFDPDLWQTVIEQGWTALHLPEQNGGLGLGPVELSVVSEEISRACMPGPFLATLWAATLLGQLEQRPQVSQYLSSIIDGKTKATVALLEEDESWDTSSVQLLLRKNNGDFQLDGVKTFVMDAATADVLLCIARDRENLAVVALPKGTAGINSIPLPAIDATRKLYEVTFKNVPVKRDQVLASGPVAARALEHANLIGAMVVCAETVGAMQWVLETTVEYAKSRQQFGSTIGSFQAVQHLCADMLLYTESARAATRFAAWSLTSADSQAAKAVSVAKAYCSDMGTEVCNHGVQVHGGIGFTWEHDLHLYLKRVTLNKFLFGESNHHREKIARAILD